jgi:hypothetical protein
MKIIIKSVLVNAYPINTEIMLGLNVYTITDTIKINIILINSERAHHVVFSYPNRYAITKYVKGYVNIQNRNM